MTLKQLFLVLKARSMLTIGVALGTLLLATLWVFTRPTLYTATASVLVDGRNNGALDPINGNVVPMTGPSNLIVTQADIVRSERVVKRAMRALKQTEDPLARAQWLKATDGEGDFEAWLAEQVQANLDVSPAKDANVIGVSYTAPNPRTAAEVTNAIVKAYMDVTLELRVDPAKQYASFFDDRAKLARESLEKAHAKLSAYQQLAGITSTEEKLDVENARLAELSTQVVALQAVVSESLSRRAAAEQRGDRTTEVLNNQVLAGLTTELARQEARLNELEVRLGDKHPSVLEQRANIQELKRRIDVETRRVSSSIGVTSDINQSRLAQVRAELDLQRAKVLKMKAQRDELAVLEREKDHAQKNYDLVMSRVSQTNLESQNNQTSVSMLKDATRPSLPSSPKIKQSLTIAAVLGLILGVGASLLLELINPRLRGEEDVLARIHIPVLGTLPNAEHATGTPQLRVLLQQMTPPVRRLLPR